MKKAFIAVGTVLLVPYSALAAAGSYSELVNSLVGVLDAVVIVLTTAAFVAFMWGVIGALRGIGGKNKDGKNTGKARFRDQLKYSVLALFILVSVWGILRLASNSIFTDGGAGGLQGDGDSELCQSFDGCGGE